MDFTKQTRQQIKGEIFRRIDIVKEQLKDIFVESIARDLDEQKTAQKDSVGKNEWLHKNLKSQGCMCKASFGSFKKITKTDYVVRPRRSHVCLPRMRLDLVTNPQTKFQARYVSYIRKCLESWQLCQKRNKLTTCADGSVQPSSVEKLFDKIAVHFSRSRTGNKLLYWGRTSSRKGLSPKRQWSRTRKQGLRFFFTGFAISMLWLFCAIRDLTIPFVNCGISKLCRLLDENLLPSEVFALNATDQANATSKLWTTCFRIRRWHLEDLGRSSPVYRVHDHASKDDTPSESPFKLLHGPNPRFRWILLRLYRTFVQQVSLESSTHQISWRSLLSTKQRNGVKEANFVHSEKSFGNVLQKSDAVLRTREPSHGEWAWTHFHSFFAAEGHYKGSLVGDARISYRARLNQTNFRTVTQLSIAQMRNKKIRHRSFLQCDGSRYIPKFGTCAAAAVNVCAKRFSRRLMTLTVNETSNYFAGTARNNRSRITVYFTPTKFKWNRWLEIAGYPTWVTPDCSRALRTLSKRNCQFKKSCIALRLYHLNGWAIKLFIDSVWRAGGLHGKNNKQLYGSLKLYS